jgi:hypothetical protein
MRNNHPGYHRRKHTVRQARLSANVLEAIAPFNAFGQRADAPLIGEAGRLPDEALAFIANSPAIRAKPRNLPAVPLQDSAAPEPSPSVQELPCV